MRYLLILLLALLLVAPVGAQTKGCEDCPAPELDPLPGPGVVEARLAKIDKFMAAGEVDTALGLLQNLSVRYPTTPDFHERALEITLDKGAPTMANTIADNLLARDPNNAKARAAKAQIAAWARRSSTEVDALELFEKLALAFELEERGGKVLQALRRYNTQKGQTATLGEANSRADILNLVKLDFLDRAYECPAPGCVFVTDEHAKTIRPSNEDELDLPRLKRPPLPTRRLLEHAVKAGSPIARKHARRLLIRSKLAAPVLVAAGAQDPAGQADYEVVEVLEDLGLAVKIQTDLKKEAVPNKATVRELFAAHTTHRDAEVRMFAAYGLALLGETPRLPKNDVRLLFAKFATSRPAEDPDFLAALLGQYPKLLRHVVKRIKAGKHSQPVQVLFRSLRETRDPRVLKFLVAALAHPKFTTSYVAIRDTLVELTGQTFEQPSEWQAWFEGGGGFRAG